MATQRQIGSKHPSRDTDSIGLIQAVDLVANGQRLMKSIDPWAGDGGPDEAFNIVLYVVLYAI
jgi:hypothetical protein